MPRKRLPIFPDVSTLLKISQFVAKMRKPIIPKLIFLKKSRTLKRFKLLSYNYGFMQEYEFSPSSTPLINYQAKKLKIRRYGDNIYSMVFCCRCLGGLKAGGGGENKEYGLSMETLPAIGAGEYSRPFALGGEEDDEEDSVDQKAERFIERFYQEMRMQRQESI